MAWQRGALAAVASLMLLAAPTEAAWWDDAAGAVGGAANAASGAVGGAASAAGGAVAGAAGSAANAVGGEAGAILQQGQNLSGAALDNVEGQACDVKTGEDVQKVNQTMSSQLESDCHTQASKLPYQHEKFFATCLSTGLANVKRTLEDQKSMLHDDCMKSLRQAPGDLTGTLASWSEQSQQSLSDTLGPQIQNAVDTARSTVQGGQSEAKFSVWGPAALGRDSGFPFVPPPVLLAFPLLVSLGGLAAWRRARSRLAPAGGDQLLSVGSDSEGAV